jgi:hypothetical protein
MLAINIFPSIDSSFPVYRITYCKWWNHSFRYDIPPSLLSGRRKSCSHTFGLVTLAWHLWICCMVTWHLFARCAVPPYHLTHPCEMPTLGCTSCMLSSWYTVQNRWRWLLCHVSHSSIPQQYMSNWQSFMFILGIHLVIVFYLHCSGSPVTAPYTVWHVPF